MRLEGLSMMTMSPGLELGHQHLVDIGLERIAVDRPVEHHGRHHAGEAQACDESGRPTRASLESSRGDRDGRRNAALPAVLQPRPQPYRKRLRKLNGSCAKPLRALSMALALWDASLISSPRTNASTTSKPQVMSGTGWKML